MTVIDFHTHVFPEKIAPSSMKLLADRVHLTPFTNGTAEGLVQEMHRSGVTLSVVLPVLTNPQKFEHVNAFALEINEKYKEGKARLVSLGAIHPDCEDVKNKMAWLKDHGFAGVKIHPDYQRTFIDDERYLRILFEARENDMVVVAHSGLDDGFSGSASMCPPERSILALKKVKGVKLVLAHFGANRMWERSYEILAGEDVYFDTAYSLDEMRTETFLNFVKKHGAERFLFGTDSPWKGQKEFVEIVKNAPLSEREKELIFYKNANTLLKI